MGVLGALRPYDLIGMGGVFLLLLPCPILPPIYRGTPEYIVSG